MVGRLGPQLEEETGLGTHKSTLVAVYISCTEVYYHCLSYLYIVGQLGRQTKLWDAS